MASKNKYSNFWLDNDLENKFFDPLTGKSIVPDGADIFELIGYQRAISNFVRIACAKDIPVKYSSKGDSFTTGKEVILSKNINTGNFDVAVGLALHEGSHILLTDFTILKKILNCDPQLLTDSKCPAILNSIYARKDNNMVLSKFKELLNIVEDRRIDAYMKEHSPGYIGYYEELYNHYFNSKLIDKMLKRREVDGIDIDSYLFHIMNFTNPRRTLDILPNLQKIYELFDIPNISRLKSTMDSFDLSLGIMSMILNSVDQQNQSQQPQPQKQQQSQQSKVVTGDDKEQEDDSKTQSNNPSAPKEESEPTPDKSNESDNESGNESEDSDSEDGKSTDDDSSTSKTSRTSFNDISAKAKKEISKQKKFINGEVKKTSLSDTESKQVRAAIESNAYIHKVGDSNLKHINVLVIKKLNQKAIDVRLTGMVSSYSNNSEPVKQGYRLGNMLASKLRIRNEEYTTKFTRQNSGKIDRRLLAELGCDVENVFDRVTKSNSKEVSLYISIDASSSMSGDRFNQSMVMAVAIARAAEITRGIRVIIDFRCSEEFGGRASRNRRRGMAGGKERATVLVAYDSKYDKTSKILKLFPYIRACGCTPEGLCFDAVMKNIEEKTSFRDSYFINLSDGGPGMSGASGSQLIDFTKKAVQQIRMKGVEVMSYLIGKSNLSDNSYFTTMYGKDARCIDTTKITEIAKTMNELLSRRTNTTTI